MITMVTITIIPIFTLMRPILIISILSTSIIGMTSMKQLEQDIQIFKNGNDKSKSLPDQLLWDIDRIHMRNRLPIFSSIRVGKDWYGEGEIGENIP